MSDVGFLMSDLLKQLASSTPLLKHIYLLILFLRIELRLLDNF